MEFTLPLVDERAILETAGGKGASLARLAASGLSVPDGFHVTTAAYRAFVAENDLQGEILCTLQDADPLSPVSLETASKYIQTLFARAAIPTAIANEIVAAYNALPGTDPPVAVRSSATAEDLPGASFAGQQETFLNITGASALLDATKKCWASLWTARAVAYRARQGIQPEHVALAVVVQLLAKAEAAGVLFTANPVTGNRRQAMISASWGLGEAVVSGIVTPDTLVVDKENVSVLSRETAEKEVMIVRQEGGTRQQAVPAERRRLPVLDDDAAADLTRLGNQIEALYGMPMDIEWAWSAGEFSILQARPITSIPPETAKTGLSPGELPVVGPVPDEMRAITGDQELKTVSAEEWKLPDGAYMAIRNNIVELMADPLSPLFATLGLRAVNHSMTRILTAFMGRPGVLPDEPIIVVNRYAYYNGSLSAGNIARMLLGSIGIARRMMRGAVARWTEEGRPAYVQTVETWQARPWRKFPSDQLLSASRQLTEATIDAYGALVSGVIPAAWISEALFTMAHKIVARGDAASAQTYLMGFDSIPIRAEKSLYDLARWTIDRPSLATNLRETATSQLANLVERNEPPEGGAPDDWQEWHGRFAAHLQQFGHTIYNLDFASPVPADQPQPLLETLKYFMTGGGVDPHERQQETAARREEATGTTLGRLKGWRLKLFRTFLEPARRFAPLREDGLADVGLAYPLIRQMLLELGERLRESGLIEEASDIFWLEEDEIEASIQRLEQELALAPRVELVQQRKRLTRAAANLTPPLGLMRLLRFNVKMKQRGRQRDKSRLKGVGCSPGLVTAPARVIHDPGEFGDMQPGEILVASITTPAWTPLFALAAGIVTDVGGPLSHGSIVAREYGIPAVLGTGTATKRLHSGQRITVDGSSGTVLLANRDR